MADDLPELKEEVSRLRGDLDRVLQILQQQKSGQSRFLQLEAGMISVQQTAEGRAAIYLNDSEGEPRGVLQVDDEGARFEIWNKARQVVVSIGETNDGAGEIYVAGADGKPRAGLKVTAAGGVLTAQSPEGRINVLMIAKSGGGTIVVANADGQPLVEIAATEGRGTVDIKESGEG
jgi:hypothetical protein